MRKAVVSFLLLFMASCYGPAVKTVRDSREGSFTKESALQALKDIKGCEFDDFVILDMGEKGILFEERRNTDWVVSREPIKAFPLNSFPPIHHGIKDCRDVGSAGFYILFSFCFGNEHDNPISIEKSSDNRVFLLPWSDIREVKIVYPISNAILSFSILFFIVPNFYILDIYNTEGKLILSIFPRGQMKNNFLLFSGLKSNYTYCKKIAEAMLFLKGKEGEKGNEDRSHIENK
ncbi:MAG: hypothetical protein ACYTHM_11215 [Planctomycetota bacterium]